MHGKVAQSSESAVLPSNLTDTFCIWLLYRKATARIHVTLKVTRQSHSISLPCEHYRLFWAEARFRYQNSPRGVWCRQNGAGTDLPSSTSTAPVIIIPSSPHSRVYYNRYKMLVLYNLKTFPYYFTKNYIYS